MEQTIRGIDWECATEDLAVRLTNFGFYPEALWCARLLPKSTATLKSEAIALYYLGHYQESLDLLDQVLNSVPHSVYLLLMRGNALMKLKRLRDATKTYRALGTPICSHNSSIRAHG
jgi:predicted Zn-dependent protease